METQGSSSTRTKKGSLKKNKPMLRRSVMADKVCQTFYIRRDLLTLFREYTNQGDYTVTGAYNRIIAAGLKELVSSVGLKYTLEDSKS